MSVTDRTALPRAVPVAAAVAFLATTADSFVLFLLLWVAQPQGWSGPQTAVMVLVLRLPTLVSGVPLGAAVDRWGARPLLLLDLVTRATLLTAMAVAGRSGDLPLAAVLVLGGISGALSPATYTAVRWLLPRLVTPTTCRAPTPWSRSATSCRYWSAPPRSARCSPASVPARRCSFRSPCSSWQRFWPCGCRGRASVARRRRSTSEVTA